MPPLIATKMKRGASLYGAVAALSPFADLPGLPCTVGLSSLYDTRLWQLAAGSWQLGPGSLPDIFSRVPGVPGVSVLPTFLNAR